jgi:hypothetical protein
VSLNLDGITQKTLSARPIEVMEEFASSNQDIGQEFRLGID